MRRHLLALVLLAAPLPAAAQDAAPADDSPGFFSRLFGGGAEDPPELLADQAAEDDEGFLTGFLEDKLSATARAVDIQGFAGALSSRATIERLTIADNEGVWLVAEGLALQWTRSQLLRGRIEIDELTADSVEIRRPPVPDPESPAPEARAFRLPELPVSLSVGALRVDRLALDSSLLGEDLALALAGSVDLAGGEGSATLTADTLEGATGHLDLTGSYSNTTGILALALDLDEGEGGLVARALDLPGLPPVSLTLEGTAPIDDYEANLAVATSGQPRIDGTLVLKTTDDDPGEGYVAQRAFGLDVRGDVTPFLAGDAGAFLGPDVTLRAKGVRRSDGSVVVTSLGIDGQAVTLAGRAELDPTGWPRRLDLTGAIGIPSGEPVPLPLIPGTEVRGVELEVDYDAREGDAWTGRFAIRDLAAGGITVDALDLQGGGLLVPATETEPGRFTALLDYTAQGVAAADAALGQALGADLTGRLDLVRDDGGGPLRIRALTLAGPGLDASLEGTVAGAGDGFLVDSSLLLQAEDLGRFAELTGLDLGGSADLTVVSSLKPFTRAFDLALGGTTQNLALGRPLLDPFLKGAGDLTLAASRDERGLRLDTLSLTTDAVAATGTAELTSGESHADFDLAIRDLAVALPTLSGPADVTLDYRRAANGEGTLAATATLPGASASLDAAIGADVPRGSGTRPGLATVTATLEAAELHAFAPLLDPLLPDPLSLRGAVSLTATGTTELDLALFDLTVAASTRDLALGLPALDAALAGEGTHAARLVRTGLDSLRVQDLRVSTPQLEAKLSADLAEGAADATLDVALADVAPILGGLSGPGRVTGTAARGDGGATDLDLAVELPVGTATATGTLAPGATAFDGTLSADLEDLGPVGRLIGRRLSGALSGTATGSVATDLSTFDLALDLATRDVTLALPPVDALLRGDGTVTGRAARTAPLSFVAEDLRIQTDLLSGTVDATFDDGTGTAALDLALADVAPVLGGLSGPGTVSGTATGTGEAIDLDLALSLPTGTGTLQGTLAPATQTFTGDVAADFADIAPLGPLVGRDLGGAISGTASGTARADLSVLDLAFDATTRDLRLGIPRVDPFLRGPGTARGTVARDAQGNLALDLALDTPQIEGSAQGTLGPAGTEGTFDLALADLSLVAPSLSGPARAQGTARRAADGSAAIDATATGPGLAIDLDATVAPPAEGSRLTFDARTRLADVSPLSPLLGRPITGGFDGTVNGTADPSFATFDIAADGTATDLALGISVVDQALAGSGPLALRLVRGDDGVLRIASLDARLPNVAVTASGPLDRVEFDARLTDLGLYVPLVPGGVTARGTAAFTAQGPVIDATVQGPSGLDLRVNGLAGARLDLALAGSSGLELFNRLIDPRRIDGPATFDLRLTGPTLADLQGTVTARGARVTDPQLGEALRDITGTATLGGGTATLALAGTLPLGGAVAIQGPVGILPPYDANLAIAARGAVIRDPALYEATGDARITVRGSLLGGALIAGVADLTTVEGRVPTTDVGALGDLPRVYHIEPSVPVVQTLRRAGLSTSGQEISPLTGDARGGTPYGLDLLINAPARVFLRGRGLDAELGGQLRLTGTTTDVVPVGQFSLIRGRLDLLGQRFDLTEGSATLQGDFNPFIRVVAQTEARTGTQVSVIVEGPLESPDVRFESVPPLPEDEVLAQLLFGVDLASITPLQAVRLASAVATLAGSGGGLLDDLRAGAGLADFDVTTTESGNVALRLGRYITDNVYTDVVVSPEETELTINLDLTPDLTVRAGVTTRGETSLGIYYERDY